MKPIPKYIEMKPLKRNRKDFIWLFNRMPEKMRHAVWEPYGSNPRTLLNCFYEIKGNTKLGKELLKELGFKDE